MTNSEALSAVFLMLDADVFIKLAQHPANIGANRSYYKSS